MLLTDFVKQAETLDDPDVLNTFITWRKDPRLDTLLLLASQLTDDSIDQLVFYAEDLFAQSPQDG